MHVINFFRTLTYHTVATCCYLRAVALLASLQVQLLALTYLFKKFKPKLTAAVAELAQLLSVIMLMICIIYYFESVNKT